MKFARNASAIGSIGIEAVGRRGRGGERLLGVSPALDVKLAMGSFNQTGTRRPNFSCGAAQLSDLAKTVHEVADHPDVQHNALRELMQRPAPA